MQSLSVVYQDTRFSTDRGVPDTNGLWQFERRSNADTTQKHCFVQRLIQVPLNKPSFETLPYPP